MLSAWNMFCDVSQTLTYQKKIYFIDIG